MLVLHKLDRWRRGESFPKEPDNCPNKRCGSPLTSPIGVHNAGTTYRCTNCRKAFYVQEGK